MNYTYHESPGDLVASQKAIGRYARYTKLRPVQLCNYDVIDFAMMRHDSTIDHYVEYKRRQIAFNKFKEICISDSKVRHAQGRVLDCFFLIEWNDEVFGLLNLKARPKYYKVASNNRGDKNDIETLAYFNIEQDVKRLRPI